MATTWYNGDLPSTDMLAAAVKCVREACQLESTTCGCRAAAAVRPAPAGLRAGSSPR